MHYCSKTDEKVFFYFTPIWHQIDICLWATQCARKVFLCIILLAVSSLRYFFFYLFLALNENKTYLTIIEAVMKTEWSDRIGWREIEKKLNFFVLFNEFHKVQEDVGGTISYEHWTTTITSFFFVDLCCGTKHRKKIEKSF